MQTATKCFGPPRTIALVTGDGNRNEGRTSFPACIEIALKHGWRVELHTWRATMNRIYHKFEGEYGSHHFRIHFLDTLLRAASR